MMSQFNHRTRYHIGIVSFGFFIAIALTLLFREEHIGNVRSPTSMQMPQHFFDQRPITLLLRHTLGEKRGERPHRHGGYEMCMVRMPSLFRGLGRLDACRLMDVLYDGVHVEKGIGTEGEECIGLVGAQEALGAGQFEWRDGDAFVEVVVVVDVAVISIIVIVSQILKEYLPSQFHFADGSLASKSMRVGISAGIYGRRGSSVGYDEEVVEWVAVIIIIFVVVVFILYQLHQSLRDRFSSIGIEFLRFTQNHLPPSKLEIMPLQPPSRMTIGHDLCRNFLGIPSRHQHPFIITSFGVKIHVVDTSLPTFFRFFDGLANVQIDPDEVPFIICRS
mmetsp:Transcript_26081/g.53356  ORF Transcript_26081/g.53356 Transcript_26081/m.53356 type:complete len:333 (+) Transcript_26081:647-1645(+)